MRLDGFVGAWGVATALIPRERAVPSALHPGPSGPGSICSPAGQHERYRPCDAAAAVHRRSRAWLRRVHAERSLPFARLALVLAIVLYALFGILDLYIVPSAAKWIWLIRYAFFCPVALVVLRLTFTRWFKPIMQPVLTGMAIWTGVGIVAMIAIAPPTVGYRYYAGPSCW